MEKLGEAGEDDRTVKAASFHGRGTFPVKGFRSGSSPGSLCQDCSCHCPWVIRCFPLQPAPQDLDAPYIAGTMGSYSPAFVQCTYKDLNSTYLFFIVCCSKGNINGLCNSFLTFSTEYQLFHIFRTKISERSNLQKLGSWFQRDFTLSGGKPLHYSWQWEHVVDTHHMVPQMGAEFRLEARKAIKFKGLPLVNYFHHPYSTSKGIKASK